MQGLLQDSGLLPGAEIVSPINQSNLMGAAIYSSLLRAACAVLSSPDPGRISVAAGMKETCSPCHLSSWARLGRGLVERLLEQPYALPALRELSPRPHSPSICPVCHWSSAQRVRWDKFSLRVFQSARPYGGEERKGSTVRWGRGRVEEKCQLRKPVFLNKSILFFPHSVSALTPSNHGCLRHKSSTAAGE